MNFKLILESICFFLGSALAFLFLAYHSDDRRTQELLENIWQQQIVGSIPAHDPSLGWDEKLVLNQSDKNQKR